MLEFTHMMPLERPIWRRWLAATDLPIQRVVYDLHLGAGSPIDPAWPEWLKRQIRAVSRKRVDAVVYCPGQIVICEVKPRAGMSALGQCLSYRELFIREKAPLVPVAMLVVCERVEPDVDRIYAQFGVGIAVV